MSELNFNAFRAVIQQMLGEAFWPLAITAALVVLLFLIALWRGRGRRGIAAKLGLIAGLLAAIATAGLAPGATQASFTNLNGLVDWGLLALIGASAFAAVFALAFALAVFASTEPGADS